MRLKNRTLFADLILLLVTLLWGLTFITVKDGIKSSSFSLFIFLRFFIATILLFPFTIKRWKKVRKKNIYDGITLGIFVFAGFYLQTAGLKYTTPSRSAFITGLSVIIVPFLSILFFKKRINFFTFLALIFSVAGLLFIFNPSFSSRINLGDILTLTCALVFAFVIIFVQIFNGRNDTFILVFIQFLTVSFLSLIFIFFEGVYLSLNKNFYIGMFYTSVFATFFALLLQNRFQKDTNEVRAGIIYTLEPVFASIFSYLIYGERFTVGFLVGSTLIFIGFLMSKIFVK
ncbi:MAG: DMT family transporter [bacterium]|uniref:DMT family permease n=2 Tax=Bacteria candidate phyla TaxID=1783234 RepID=A0A101I1N5_UNCT6|nr:MAG: DMT family permease [candidate division TA06 bacterium 32_111]KUK87005.1 MAG: DMT family permease [candidate division TA06 bacterium 34_109]MDI6701263.1 DMT family transporter [bacterium]HAF06823.1 EamA/RhaT family transporter [candidate division WOR-3 bacterium]HCP17004.1 EamA/RhaT family transporter [candidate division WOR-3 bacterium]